MSSPLDAQLLNSQMGGQELIRRKLEMDALKQRLGDPNARDKKLRESVEGFEAIFVQKIWQQMRATVPKEGYLHGKDEEFWQGMFDQELSKKLTSAGGIGLSDMLYEQLKGELNNASRTTAPSRVTTPLPIEPLKRADHIIPTKQDSGTTIEGDPLYAPLEQDATENSQPVHDIDTTSQRPTTPPLSLTQEDTDALARVESLARSIVDADKKTTNSQYAPAGGGEPFRISKDHASPIEPTSGTGGPAPRNPEMGMLNWPLPGNITSGFGWRDDPFTGDREWHAGIDIIGEVGDPIAAAWDGKVVYAGEKEGYGNLVVLEHEGGWQSYYGHTSKISVKVGDEIRSGKKIAEVGNTGRSTGPHLHFEMRQGELAWNPEKVRNRLLAGHTVGRRS